MDTAASPQPITRASELEKLARLLNSQPILGVDTESNSLYAFREQVCLIQFSTSRSDYLVDPLALDDLSPLGEVFANPAIKKVFHAAEYDLICLKRDFGFTFVNLFDTMTAARMLGRKEVGLGALLGQEFDVLTDKRNQRADWGVRPLPAGQLRYATQDTHYLIPLYERLRGELEEKKLLELAQEDFERLCRITVPATNGDAHAWWRIGGSHELTPQQAAVLQSLSDYRTRMAEVMNRPLFKVMGDKTLAAIALHCPGTLPDLAELPGMTPKQLQRHGKSLLQAVQRGLEAESLYPPRAPRPDERYLARMDVLRDWRRDKALALGVESDVVLPRELLGVLAAQNPLDLPAMGQALSDYPQRLERFGAEILAVLVKLDQNNSQRRPRRKRSRHKLVAGIPEVR